MKKNDAKILVSGNFNEHALSKLRNVFDIKEISRGDIAQLDREEATSIRGVASMGGVSAEFIDALPQLEIIANFGVGYDAVAISHAVEKNIMITNTPDVLTEEVADTALGLLLNTVRELSKAETYLRDGKWESEGAYPLSKLTLRNRKAGIFGLGRIGLAIAKRLEAFGMTVAYHNRRPVEGVEFEYYDTLTGLAQAVDTLIVVVPGSASTAKAVNAEVLKALGSDGVLINIGRGSVVDEDALVEALSNNVIAAAGLDVFEDEPKVRQALKDLPNAVLLPHVGSASMATRRAMAELVADNLISWFNDGTAVTPVSETLHITKRK